MSGGEIRRYLEDPTIKLAKANMKDGAQIYRLGETTIAKDDWAFDFSFPKDIGKPNPLLWINVPFAMKYAELSADWLKERDAANGA